MQILAAIGLFHNLREAKMQLTIGELEDILLELKTQGVVRSYAFGEGLKRGTELVPWEEDSRCICTVRFKCSDTQREASNWEFCRDLPLFGIQLRNEELAREWLRELLLRSLNGLNRADKDCPAVVTLCQKIGDRDVLLDEQDTAERKPRKYRYRYAGRAGRRRARQELVRRWFSSRKRRRRMDPGDKAMIWMTIIVGSLAALYRFLMTILA